MKVFIILVAVLAVAVGLFIVKPWEPKRYDDSPAGVDARKIDDHVEQAKAWRPPNTIEARELLGAKPDPKRYIALGTMGYEETKTLINDLYNAGAMEVAFCNVKRSVRTGDAPEGLYVAVPDDDQTKRDAIFAVAGRWYKEAGKQTPPDVKQKYLYFGYGEWSPADPEPGFLPTE
jgi:hypothetical protein